MIDFKNEIAKQISGASGIEVNELYEYLEVPPNKEMGDYAFPCFKLAKTLKKAPPVIAQELKEKIVCNEYIKEVQIAGGYLNFFINEDAMINDVLNSINNQKEQYGSSDIGNGKTIVIDYSSPNIAKPFHIGHLRTTIIGASLYNVYKFLGYKVVGVNHLGDYGTQFGKLIEGYKRWGEEYNIESNPIDELMKIYVRINDLCKEDETVLEACRENFKKLEEKDEYCTKIWNWFREVSLKEFQRVYDILGVKFDSLRGEAAYSDSLNEIVDILDKSGVLTDSEGAKIVDLEDKGLGVCMIQKSDGTTIYAARDLAAIKYRVDNYDFDKCLYVVAYEQALHFRQVFEVAKHLGIPEKCVNGLEHVEYGMTRLTTGRMSTREGTVVKVNDLLNESISRIEDIINEKNPDMENKKENAEKIGIGAVIFNNLCNNIIKDQIFDWDTVLNFQGETGPYIQYVYVRTKSVLEKLGYIPEFGNVKSELLNDAASQDVIRTLYKFNEVLESVTVKNEPSFLARYLIELGQKYSNFYNENKIMVDDKNLQDARAYLTYAVGIVIKTGAALLGIKMPTQM